MKRKQKNCLGCHDPFLTYRNYDYCQNCAINQNRYAQNQCSECGDGSGQVKFKNQPPRPCKLCYLTKNSMTWNKKTKKTNLSPKKIDPETQFWNQVAEKSKSLIADLVETILPATPQDITSNLEQDPDYQTLLREDLPRSYAWNEEYQEKITNQSWDQEDVEAVAQDLTCNYFDGVVRSLLGFLSNYYGFKNTALARYNELYQN